MKYLLLVLRTLPEQMKYIFAKPRKGNRHTTALPLLKSVVHRRTRLRYGVKLRTCYLVLTTHYKFRIIMQLFVLLTRGTLGKSSRGQMAKIVTPFGCSVKLSIETLDVEKLSPMNGSVSLALQIFTPSYATHLVVPTQ